MSNILRYEMCVDKQCNNGSRLMKEIFHARKHKNHDWKTFEEIRQTTMKKECQERFDNMITSNQVKDLIISQRYKLIEVYTKEITAYTEKLIQDTDSKDDNQSARFLFQEISKEIEQIDLSNIEQYDSSLIQLLDQSLDSKKLLLFFEQVKSSIELLNNDLNNIFQKLNSKSSNEIIQQQANNQVSEDLDDLYGSNQEQPPAQQNNKKEESLPQNSNPLTQKNQNENIKLRDLQTTAQLTPDQPQKNISPLINQQFVEQSRKETQQSETQYTVNQNSKRKELFPSEYEEFVSAIAISEQYIAAATKTDAEIVLWSIKNNQPFQTFTGHRGDKCIFGLKFTKNGKKLISGSEDESIKVWDVENKKLYWDIKILNCKVHSIAINPKNEEQFLSSGSENTIKIWNISKRKQDGELSGGHQKEVKTICYSDDGELLASGGLNDSKITIWDGNSLTLKITFQSYHNQAVRGLLFSKDKRQLISTGDSFIKIWDLKTFSCIKNMEGHSGCNIYNICFLFEEKLLVSVSYGGNLTFFDISKKNDEKVGELTELSQEIWGLSKSFDETKLLIGSSDGKVIIFEISDLLIKNQTVSESQGQQLNQTPQPTQSEVQQQKQENQLKFNQTVQPTQSQVQQQKQEKQGQLINQTPQPTQSQVQQQKQENKDQQINQAPQPTQSQVQQQKQEKQGQQLNQTPQPTQSEVQQQKQEFNVQNLPQSQSNQQQEEQKLQQSKESQLQKEQSQSANPIKQKNEEKMNREINQKEDYVKQNEHQVQNFLSEASSKENDDDDDIITLGHGDLD